MKLLFFFLILPQLSFARWAKPHEADSSIEKNDVHIQIHKDATAVTDTHLSFYILKETARERWGTLRLAYYPKNSHYKITEASTRNEDQNFDVSGKDIVDSAIQATEHGFDEQRQIVIAFPHVKTGSLLSYSSHEELHHPAAKDTFSWRLNFGEGSLFNHSEIDVVSERPLYFQINDPDSYLEFTNLSDPKLASNQYHYHIHLKRPILKQVVDEDQIYLQESQKVWVSISTAETYPQMFKSMAESYEEILAKPLPKVFQNILAQVRDVKNPTDQLNQMTSLLSETVRYMGDWRAVDGGLVPHSLEEIATSRHGDCKDFSIVIVKMLRELGYEATPALVERSPNPRELPKIPQLASFNHAIAAVMVGAERHWLDGTNFLSDADGVTDDIAFREALLMNPKNIHLEEVKWSGPEKNLSTQKVHGTLLSDDNMATDLEVDATGYMAHGLVGQELRQSHEQLENLLLERHFYKADLLEHHIADFDFKSRIVGPVNYKISVKKSIQNFQTSLGNSLPISHLDLSYIYKLDVRDRVSSFLLGLPATYRMEFALDHFDYRGKSIRDCEVKSPAIDYSMKVHYLPKAVKIVSELKIKQRYLAPDELLNPKFVHLQKEIKECAREKYFVYKSANEPQTPLPRAKAFSQPNSRLAGRSPASGTGSNSLPSH